ncbi:hypothetical protein ACFX1T_019975 [Malus domestica]
MDRDREANTRCMWFTQIGHVHRVEEFSLIVKSLHKYIGRCGIFSGSTFPPSRGGLVKRDTNHVVGVPQVAELGDLPK